MLQGHKQNILVELLEAFEMSSMLIITLLILVLSLFLSNQLRQVILIEELINVIDIDKYFGISVVLTLGECFFQCNLFCFVLLENKVLELPQQGLTLFTSSVLSYLQ